MADNNEIFLGPPPNFDLISQRHHNLGREMAKILNLPQFETGDAILDQLRQIDTKLDTIVYDINARLEAR
jgi:hypothetical protein